jgi:hypothetical protein
LISNKVVDSSVSKRAASPVQKKAEVIEKLKSAAGLREEPVLRDHPITVVNTRKAYSVDPEATYMAPRQWIKMLPNDDDDSQSPWADQVRDGLQVTSTHILKSQ